MQVRIMQSGQVSVSRPISVSEDIAAGWLISQRMISYVAIFKVYGHTNYDLPGAPKGKHLMARTLHRSQSALPVHHQGQWWLQHRWGTL